MGMSKLMLGSILVLFAMLTAYAGTAVAQVHPAPMDALPSGDFGGQHGGHGTSITIHITDPVPAGHTVTGADGKQYKAWHQHVRVDGDINGRKVDYKHPIQCGAHVSTSPGAVGEPGGDDPPNVDPIPEVYGSYTDGGITVVIDLEFFDGTQKEKCTELGRIRKYKGQGKGKKPKMIADFGLHATGVAH
jgi:hypothetical protein